MSIYTDNSAALVELIFKAEEPKYTATTPILAYSIRSLGNAFKELEDELMPQVLRAKQGAAYQDNLNLLRLVLLNLVAVGFQHKQLTIPASAKEGNYLHDKFKLNQRKITRLTSVLVENGLAEKVFFGSQSLNIAGAYRPTKKLMLQYTDYLYSYVGNFDEYDPIRFDGVAIEDNVDWYENTEEDRQILTNYNAFMRQFTWAMKDVTHRSFGVEPFTASRVHTPFQTIVNRRVTIRKQTLLDGERIAEPDFTSNHLTMLAMMHDEHLPDDPYTTIADELNIPRSTIKTVLVRLMGAKDENGYNQAKYSLSKDRELKLPRATVDRIRSAFNKHIPFLKKHDILCTGWGNRLQFLEGQIAMKMLSWAVEEQTPILNVHDAYACKTKDESKVQRAMLRYRDEVIDEYIAVRARK